MNILLICTGNTCRSSMAEGFLKAMLNDIDENNHNFNVMSAGISAMDGEYPSEHAIEALKEHDIDISDFRSKQVTESMIEEADLILTMTSSHKNMITSNIPNANNKTFTLKEYIQNDCELGNIFEELELLYTSFNDKKEVLEREIEEKVKELNEVKENSSEDAEELEKRLVEFISKAKENLMIEYDKIKSIESKIQKLDISDPYGRSLDIYKECAKEIRETLEKLITLLLKK